MLRLVALALASYRRLVARCWNGVSAHANVMLVSRNSVGLVKHVFVPWGCAILTELSAGDCKAGNSVKV